uniref:Uncharacterized protein n=1 Tax=Panagrolaimus sp. JU765 TaxID=591449 RepID=A0AC34RAL0_9BILA
MPSTYVFPVQERTPRPVKEFKSPMSSGKDPQRPAYTPFTPLKKHQPEYTDAVVKDNYRFFKNNLGANQILVIRDESDPKMCRDFESRTSKYYFCMQCCEIDNEQKPTVAKVEVAPENERTVYAPKVTEHLPGCFPKDYDETIEKYTKIEA